MQRVGPGPTNYSGPGGGGISPTHHPRGVGAAKTGPTASNRDLVPKIAVEEKEQEILAKDETIQVFFVGMNC